MIRWRALSTDDLQRVEAIAAQVHPALAERREVFAEKLALFPRGCFSFTMHGEMQGEMQGYAFAHPWRLFDIPALDALLGAIPTAADCLYLHDIAILPSARGHKAAPMLVALLRGGAEAQVLSALACVSVYGTDGMWTRLGFTEQRDPALEDKLRAYGAGAKYMIAPLT